MSLRDDLTRAQTAEYAERQGWNGDYDGTICPSCNRERMLKCSNGRRRCEKCNWDPDAGDYSAYEPL